MEARRNRKFWNFVDNLGGDKVVWIITLMLILLSIVCIFSASSKLLKGDITRVDIAKEQIKTVLMGLAALLLVYNIRRVEILKWFSQWGFIVSLLLLLSLLILPNDKEAPIHAARINGAVRSIMVFGIQFHIFEVVKVAMVLYFAWSIDRSRSAEGYKGLKKLSKALKWKWLGTTLAQKAIFLYIPFFATVALVMKGSNSSGIFMAGIFLLTIAIGQSSVKDALTMGAIAILAGSLVLGAYLAKGDNGKGEGRENRIETLIGRLHHVDHEKEYLAYGRQEDLDAIRQPYSAKLAIHDSHLIGKGPGQSTQRYVVPDMPEDYMFSFIIEEYGILGGLLVIILYVSLFARGVIIVKNCGNNLYAKVTIAGLVLLICGQAFMHMFVNASFGLLTGQTLPLLSHGTSAFICFCIAFGIILSISRIASKGIEDETRNAEPIVEDETV
ncbi:MAG: FtsW/RodA/SpoVE family cell cycle protein [Bacteroidales bacterium]|nr:FtsW/RodA/SpoVE family cell cycle protein [Bacteroidales bacterium]